MQLGQAARDGVDITVTCDVFSALIDSRSGGVDFFGGLGASRSWDCSPSEVYRRWDGQNKALHRQCTSWRPYAELAAVALSEVYQALGLTGDPGEDCAGLLVDMAHWPLWPDVA